MNPNARLPADAQGKDGQCTREFLVPLNGSSTAEAVIKDVHGPALKLGAEVLLFQAIPGIADTMTGSHIALEVAQEAVKADSGPPAGRWR